MFASHTTIHQIFDYFLKDTFWNQLVEQTNKDARDYQIRQNGKEYGQERRPANTQLMSMMRESDQYSVIILEASLCYSKTCIGDILPKNRYRLLNQISEKMDKESSDREINKIKILLSVCVLCTPIHHTSNLARFDEIIVPFQGRSKFVVYMPQKLDLWASKFTRCVILQMGTV